MKLFKTLDLIIQVLLVLVWILHPGIEFRAVFYNYVYGFLLLITWQTISLTIHWIALGEMDKNRSAYFVTLFIVLCCWFIGHLNPAIMLALSFAVLLLIVISVALPFCYLWLSAEETWRYYKPPEEQHTPEEETEENKQPM